MLQGSCAADAETRGPQSGRLLARTWVSHAEKVARPCTLVDLAAVATGRAPRREGTFMPVDGTPRVKPDRAAH